MKGHGFRVIDDLGALHPVERALIKVGRERGSLFAKCECGMLVAGSSADQVLERHAGHVRVVAGL